MEQPLSETTIALFIELLKQIRIDPLIPGAVQQLADVRAAAEELKALMGE